MTTVYLTVAEVLAIHDDQIERYGGSAGIRDAGQLEAALFRPQTGYYPDLIAEAAALGRSTIAVTDYGRALSSGENAQVIILIIQRYFLKLHRVRSDMDNGSSIDDALRMLRPPLHFKQRDTFTAQVRTWTRQSLDQALTRISETALAARRSSALEDVLGERLILALSAIAAGNQGAARRR